MRTLLFAAAALLIATTPAPAQTAAYANGVICDTPEQIERFVMITDDSEESTDAAIALINKDAGKSACAPGDWVFYYGEKGKIVEDNLGRKWQLQSILIIGIVDDEGVKAVKTPLPQWSAFGTPSAPEEKI